MNLLLQIQVLAFSGKSLNSRYPHQKIMEILCNYDEPKLHLIFVIEGKNGVIDFGSFNAKAEKPFALALALVTLKKSQNGII